MSTHGDPSRSLPRKNPGRIDHILLAYHDVKRLENARDEFTAKLGMDDWDDLGNVEETGLRIFVSWSSGLELLAPFREGSALDRHLATRGEGFVSLVFGVADLDGAIARVERAGGRPQRLDPPPDGVFDRFVFAREAIVGLVGGLPLLLGEFVAKP